MIQQLYFKYNLIILIFSIKIFCCWRENEMNFFLKKKKTTNHFVKFWSAWMECTKRQGNKKSNSTGLKIKSL